MNYKSLKPLFDYLLIFIFLLPILLMTFLILLGYVIQGQFPILFSQPRIGKNGKPFIMHKFRTLSTDPTQSLTARRFPWGNFLRVTNLDELPQLWNVLKGEMSWIGPRPLPVEYHSLFKAEEKRRLQVLPGITGWTQIHDRHAMPWKEKFKLDAFYVDHLSFFLDLKILLKTIIIIFSFRKDVSLEEEKFKGN
jgi:lipopolysaccharide/colanic/teichoic acid biosynthesis glycosyltransferase